MFNAKGFEVSYHPNPLLLLVPTWYDNTVGVCQFIYAIPSHTISQGHKFLFHVKILCIV